MRTFIRVWSMPAVLAAITFGGLVSALVGDGVWDQISWVALATPIALLIRYAIAPGQHRSTTSRPD